MSTKKSDDAAQLASHKINILTCLRCEHTWVPRITDVRLCPSCKSPYWDKLKQTKKGNK